MTSFCVDECGDRGHRSPCVETSRSQGAWAIDERGWRPPGGSSWGKSRAEARSAAAFTMMLAHDQLARTAPVEGGPALSLPGRSARCVTRVGPRYCVRQGARVIVSESC